MKHAKPHLVESHTALSEGNSVTALCGQLIRRSVFVPMSETDYIPGDRMNSTQPKGVCSACLKVRVMRYLVIEAAEPVNEKTSIYLGEEIR